MSAQDQNAPDIAPRPDRRGAFRLLFFALATIGAGNTMLIAAVLPPLTRDLGLPDWMAGAIFSLSAAMWVVASPFWGRTSNTLGRRRVAAIGLAGYAASMLLFGVSGLAALSGLITAPLLIFALLLCSRSLFGIFGSGTNPAAQAYVADRTSPENRTAEMASVTAGHSFGTVAGPAFAAAMVAVFGLLSPVFFTFVLAAGMSWMILTRLPEDTPPKQKLEGPSKPPKGLWRDKRVFAFLLFATALSLVTGVLVQTFVFAVMDKMNVAGAQAAQFTGPAFTVGAMASLLAQLVLIPRLDMSNKRLMVTGALSLAFGAFLIIPAQDFATLIVAQFAIGLGQGLARPGFFAGASLAVGAEEQGDIAGLVMATNAIGFVVSPFFGPWLYEFAHPAVPFALVGVLLLLMASFAAVFAGGGQPEEAPLHADP
ncbi:MAG: MFS transporter [Pseudomonadota bacterium]